MKRYPLDSTGLKPSNRIQNEVKNVMPKDDIPTGPLPYIIPDLAPFYAGNLVVEKDGDTLQRYIDYDLVLRVKEIDRSNDTAFYGGIVFFNRLFNGEVSISYNTLGGAFIHNDPLLLESYFKVLYTQRIVTWDDIFGKPIKYPSVNQTERFVDTRAWDDIIDVIEDVIEHINEHPGHDEGTVSDLINDVNNHNHVFTKDDVFLDKVANVSTVDSVQPIFIYPDEWLDATRYLATGSPNYYQRMLGAFLSAGSDTDQDPLITDDIFFKADLSSTSSISDIDVESETELYVLQWRLSNKTIPISDDTRLQIGLLKPNSNSLWYIIMRKATGHNETPWSYISRIPIDKIPLSDALQQASQYTEEEWAGETWSNLQQAISAGQFIFNDDEADQVSVDNATQAIYDAMDGLVKRLIFEFEIETGPFGTQYEPIALYMSGMNSDDIVEVGDYLNPAIITPTGEITVIASSTNIPVGGRKSTFIRVYRDSIAPADPGNVIHIGDDSIGNQISVILAVHYWPDDRKVADRIAFSHADDDLLSGCFYLEELPTWAPYGVTNMDDMFPTAYSIFDADISMWDVDIVESWKNIGDFIPLNHLPEKFKSPSP